MPKYISENYGGDERRYIDKDGNELVSPCGLMLVAHNASGSDSWVVMNALVNKKNKNIVKTGRGWISLSFRCGLKIFNTVEVAQYAEFMCTRSHTKRFFGKNRYRIRTSTRSPQRRIRIVGL